MRHASPTLEVVGTLSTPLPIPQGPQGGKRRGSKEEGDRASRSSLPKTTHLASDTSSLPGPSSPKVRNARIHAHHHLPPATAVISEDPILYLPPLLSPLPSSVKHRHEHHHGPLEEVLSNFETRLPDIDPASLDLHQALHNFAPLDDDYAARSYDEAFNWDSLTLPEEVSREWYCVVFRSRRKPESSSLSLYQADREAHEEAVKNGGLVMYWYGVPDTTGLNLATCIWQSRRHAVKAIGGPKHMLAMKQAKDAYEVYDLERWVLRKEIGSTQVTLDRWQGGEVGW